MPDALNVPGKFVTGSTLRHVLTMTSAGTVGLVAVFLVDVVNLFYISLLGHKELAAAVGYAGTLLFFMLSLAIGLSIAVGAMTSRALGSGDRTHARQLVRCFTVIDDRHHGSGCAAAVSVFALFFKQCFTRIVLPSTPILGLGICLSALLRSLGDARRAMFVTLGAGVATAVLDPLLIFGFGWGLDGAAI